MDHIDENEREREMSFRVIDESEIADFERTAIEAGYDAQEFSLSETVHEPRPEETQGVFPLRATVTVTRRQSAYHCEYDAGHGTNWVLAFEEDLQSGLFGRSGS